MKARFVSPLGEFEVEAPEIKDVFRQLATVQEVFGAETNCGICNSEAIRLQFREIDDFKFYELVCCRSGCRARFAFGQAKKGGGLFPKRRDEDGKLLPHGGWEKYTPPGAAPEPENKTAPQSKPAPASNGTGTDARTQDRYNRLAKTWGIEKAPVRFPDFVQMARDHFASLTEPSSAGTQEFDKMYRRYTFEHQKDSLDPNNIAQFMTECYEGALALSKEQVPY